MKRLFKLIGRVFRYYNYRQIPIAAAALCYYMTMTVFPLIICLYTLLGQNYGQAMRILSFAEEFLSHDTMEPIRTFLNYVANNHSMGMALAGVTVLVTSASAGVRSMQVTIGRLQGGQRYPGIGGFIFSLFFAIVFLAATWFAIIVLFTSRGLLELLNTRIQFIDISGSWFWFKYVLLAVIMFLFIWVIYRVSRKKHMHYSTWPGAILATIGIVGTSLIFSAFIAASARYSLVYGSLASVILLMYWMYLIGQVIYIGAAFNIALRDLRQMEKKTR